MTALLTYLQFHALFVVPVLVGLAVTTPYRLAGRRTVLTATALLAGLALVYTTPWDNYLIERGVWWYGEGTVLVRGRSAPLGEYLFFVFQPFLVGLWLARFRIDTTPSLRTPASVRAVGLAAATIVGAAGLLLLDRPSGLYLGSLLAWGHRSSRSSGRSAGSSSSESDGPSPSGRWCRRCTSG
ncbi:lycopene cyclase domain-containing protein [Halomicroarcula sp. GCM10025709]|uniref:lycopene cyclase domain-containing protein n=1 Tax=Halomicroarcula sp. GCM10025709 TaxID=3252669 RepID=UPI00361731D2